MAGRASACLDRAARVHAGRGDPRSAGGAFRRGAARRADRARHVERRLLEAYLGRRSAARVLAGAVAARRRRDHPAALLFADLRGFTELSESHPPAEVIAALDAWFDRIAVSVHAFGGEVLKFIGDGVLAIFPVGGSPRAACDAALRAVSAARAGMAHLDEARRRQGLAPLPFGVALHLGEILWGNIGAADRLDFTAIGPAVNLVSRLEGLCRPLDKSVLVSGAFAAETATPLRSARNACAARHRLALRRVHGGGATVMLPPSEERSDEAIHLAAVGHGLLRSRSQ